MIDKNSNEYKRMVNRYGEDTTNMLFANAEKEKQAKSEQERKKFEAEKNTDKAMRSRYGDEMTNAINKAAKESEARFNALYSEYGDKSKYGNYFNEENSSTNSNGFGDAIRKEIAQDRANKAYKEISDEYSKKLDRLFDSLDITISARKKELESLDTDIKRIALTIIWNAIRAKYPEYFNDK